MSHLSQRPDDAVVGLALPHESAALHVTGHALYTDDLVHRTPATSCTPTRSARRTPHARVTAPRHRAGARRPRASSGC